MSNTKTTPATTNSAEGTNGTVNLSPEVKELLTKRNALIAKVAEEEATIAKAGAALTSAKEAEDEGGVTAAVAMRDSAGGRLANRVKEIASVELDLALAGHEIDPFKRQKARSKSKAKAVSQDEIVATLERMGQLFATAKHEQTKASADKRIQALLAQAKKAGLTVADPRPKTAKATK